ncbi:MAG TPA: phosphoenolpyruvate--protein phosphotransferase [Thermoanaerobaculia bacterium]|nr:phosphoenolpyruvate--protein phosphotransferase [Thermoanaerobaculia bacterium]
MRVLEGLPVSPGVAIGRAVTVDDPGDHVLRFHLDSRQVDAEIQRLELARRAAIAELVKAQHKMGESLGEDTAGILHAQALLLADPAFVARIEQTIRARQVNAEWAVLRTTEEYEARFAEIETEYLRERSEDLRNVAHYLLRSLQGIAHHEISEIEGDVVIIGRDLTPADALRFAREKVVGFALEAGGETTHTTIIVRGLNLPTVIKLDGVLDLITDRDPVIVDGEKGRLILHPTPEVLAHYQQRRGELARREAKLVRAGLEPPRTADGVEIELLANLELLEEVADARRFGCGGVGLYRSEFFFIEKSPDVPTEEEHYQLFSLLVRGMAPLPVTVRTFDLGGRELSRALFPEGDEENPVLGLRGIRLTRIRPEIMRSQLRALFRAAVHGDLRIMVPLVTTLDEVRDFRLLCELLVAELEREGIEHRKNVPLGAMIEVPGAAMIADHMARELDFLSIGTNDLIQYALAVDRNNEHVSDLYQSTHPAVLRLLDRIVEGTRGKRCELSICGEMASDPLMTPFLVGLGLRRLSMSPRAIPVVKDRVRHLRIDHLRETVATCLGLGTADEVRAYLSRRHPLDGTKSEPGKA